MADKHPQSALREWRAHLGNPVTLVILAAIAAILTLAAPYETDRLLRLVPRAGYWGVTVFATYALAWLAVAFVRRATPAEWPHWAGAVLGGIASGCIVALFVLVLNRVTFDYWPSSGDIAPFFFNIFAIALIVTGVLTVVGRTQGAAATDLSLATAESPAAGPAILDRMSLEKRGALLALSVEDHYVRVRTTKGDAMLLMRLSDAIRETGGVDGAQVHRSHWAAFGQVRTVRREGDRAVLTMSDGSEVPVSRANLPTIREAGLLPR